MKGFVSVEDLHLGSTLDAGKVVMSVGGKLDAATVPTLRATLGELIDRQEVRAVVIDLEGLTFIDSAGVHALIQALKRLRGRGGDLVLTGVRPGAHKVLDVCGLTSVFGSDPGAPRLHTAHVPRSNRVRHPQR